MSGKDKNQSVALKSLHIYDTFMPPAFIGVGVFF
jgi:hypothetical protein